MSASSATFLADEVLIKLADEIIGAIIVYSPVLELFHSVLERKYFPLHRHQLVIQVVKDLYHTKKYVDPMLVIAELRRRGQLEEAGDQLYIKNITGEAIYSSDFMCGDLTKFEHHYAALIEACKNYCFDGKITRERALELLKEYMASDRTSEELVLDLENLREKVGMPAYKWDKFIAATVRQCRKKRYKLELKRLLLIDDPLEQSLEIDEVCEVYRKRRGVVQSDMVRMEAKTYTKENHSPRLAIEYDQVEVKPKPYLIPDFLPSAASILLSGVSGTAKTQFMLDMTESLLEGHDFLGLKPSKRSKVLLLITDQSTEQSLAYLRNKGIDLTNPNLALWLRGGDDPGFTINDLAKLREFIEDFRPDFIGADSLRTILCHPTGISENDIEIGSHLNKLTQEATRFGSTFLLIHHENKSTEFKGVSKSSGSGDIPARFDIHWRLEKPLETSETRIFTTAKTRSSSRSGRLTLNMDECRFELERWDMESPEFSKALSSTVSRIDHLLNINPQGLAIWDIETMMAEAGTPVSTRTVRRCLAQMTASQSIGRKQHPNHQRAFLYYKLQPDDEEKIFSSDTSHSDCHNNSEKAKPLDVKEQLTVTPTMTSDDSTVSSTTDTPPNEEECHRTETSTQSEVSTNCDNSDTDDLPPKKNNVVQSEVEDVNTTPVEVEVISESVVTPESEPKVVRQDLEESEDDIKVGCRVIILSGPAIGKQGTVEAINPLRVNAPYYIRLNNGCTTDEPKFNLERI